MHDCSEMSGLLRLKTPDISEQRGSGLGCRGHSCPLCLDCLLRLNTRLLGPVAGFVDLAHAAPAQQLDELVAIPLGHRERRARGGGRRGGGGLRREGRIEGARVLAGGRHGSTVAWGLCGPQGPERARCRWGIGGACPTLPTLPSKPRSFVPVRS